MKKTLLFMLLLVSLAGFRVSTSRTISGTINDSNNHYPAYW